MEPPEKPEPTILDQTDPLTGEEPESIPTPSRRTLMRNLWLLCGALVLIVVAITAVVSYRLLLLPPSNFPAEKYITIPEGTNLDEATRLLYSEGLINSPLALKLFVKVQGNERGIKAGDYLFENPQNSWEIARRIATADYGITPITVTIPEGATSYQIAEILTDKLNRFDTVTFSERAKEREGYLFPDTYQFMPNVTIEEILDTMERNFYNQVAELEPMTASSTFSLHEILTLASLLEKEARQFETRKKIAGIIFNRLEVNMPLQIDAVFGYIYGRETFNPRFSHLAVESPYNTYKNRGLPPGPIANPGIESIQAALEPIANEYLFYLTGRDGNMYYSNTYEGHLWNRRMYLD